MADLHRLRPRLPALFPGWRGHLFTLALTALATALFLTVFTLRGLEPLPATLAVSASELARLQVVDRDHYPLSHTYQNRWNVHDLRELHQFPEFLQRAMVLSEDKRFYRHHGVDWQARLHAVLQNLQAWRAVRGASTISEQVVRMLHPRPRTLWSRWLEGFEAASLERSFSKPDILEFYLNQVPYGGQRRGVAQAARYYFDRDLDTLSHLEMLALVVLVRAPSRMDPFAAPGSLTGGIDRLVPRLITAGLLDPARASALHASPLQLADPRLPVNASHFIEYIAGQAQQNPLPPGNRLHTTLDSSLQNRIQLILDQRLRDLAGANVRNGAALVVDHQTGEILAWVVGNCADPASAGSQINAVLSQRQPGSTLKPFLYGLAMEQGWTAATLIEDSPLSSFVGAGLHTFHNYSRQHYGPVTLREALGNSLNVPAVRAIKHVGGDTFLSRLKQLGVTSLTQHPDFYGDGLALGNGEISLFELVQAYATLARGGLYLPLRGLMHQPRLSAPRPVYSPEISSLLGHILSDPEARRLEFGSSTLLHFPLQTAVKTGTSSDYRDAWAIGYNYRYAFGIWLGNLDGTPMLEITGARGPALALRAVAAEVIRHQETRPLYLSPRLIQKRVAIDRGPEWGGSFTISEWFVPGGEPLPQRPIPAAATKLPAPSLVQPVNGLQLAMDPRLPDDREAFVFLLRDVPEGATIDWYVDGKLAARTRTLTYAWPLSRGGHAAHAMIWPPRSRKPLRTNTVSFMVF